MLNLVWRAEARDDVRSIFRYITDRDRGAARRLLAAIESCAEGLPTRPFMYRPGRASGTREAVVHPNHIAVYRVTDVSVGIVRVVHTRRQHP